jgi:hypothetical protein
MYSESEFMNFKNFDNTFLKTITIPPDFLEEKNIPLERYSQDVDRVNKYGTKLLELCKRCNLFIGNDQLFSDQGIGRTTCKDASLVDYLLLSPSFFDIITDFEIVEFDLRIKIKIYIQCVIRVIF